MTDIRKQNMRIVFSIYCFTVGFVGTELSGIATYYFGLFDVWEALWFGMLVGAMIGVVLTALFWGKL